MVVGRVTFTMVLLMMLTNLPVGLLFEPFQSSSMTCSCTFVCSHSAKIVRSVERNIIILVCSVGCSTQGCLERGGGGRGGLLSVVGSSMLFYRYKHFRWSDIKSTHNLVHVHHLPVYKEAIKSINFISHQIHALLLTL